MNNFSNFFQQPETRYESTQKKESAPFMEVSYQVPIRCRYESINFVVSSSPQEQFYHYLNQLTNGGINKAVISMAKVKSIDYLKNKDQICQPEIISKVLCDSEETTKSEAKVLLTFIEKNKQNLYKNVLKAFKNHIAQCQDKFLITLYQNLSKDKWSYTRIKQRVYQILKLNGRFNLKVKNIINNKNLQNIFLYFLKNCKQLWLSHSKINDKQFYLEQIDLIIRAYNEHILQSYTKYYKKSRQ